MLLITFFLTIIFDLTVAIEVGLIIACLLFMKRMSETTDVKVIMDEINEESDIVKGNLEHLTIPQGVEVCAKYHLSTQQVFITLPTSAL